MSLWAVVREAGPAWSPGGIYDQVDGDAHAVFMNGLADEGLVRFGGPLAGTQDGRVRVLLVVDADDEAEDLDREQAELICGHGRIALFLPNLRSIVYHSYDS